MQRLSRANLQALLAAYRAGGGGTELWSRQRHAHLLPGTGHLRQGGDVHGARVCKPLFYSYGLLQFGEKVSRGPRHGSRCVHASASVGGPGQCYHIPTGMGGIAAKHAGCREHGRDRGIAFTENGGGPSSGSQCDCQSRRADRGSRRASKRHPSGTSPARSRAAASRRRESTRASSVYQRMHGGGSRAR